jgi:geranylgeranylglycerol-phosphate geranylgeranyltransferase
LTRPVNSIMMGFAVVVGASLTSQRFLSIIWPNIIYGFVTGFMLTAASMTINDYYDRKIDTVNEPKRPIPSGLIQPKEALSSAFVLTAVGFATAYVTNIFCFVIAIIAWLVFVTYTTIGKRSGLPGNFLVSTCVAIPFIYGSLAAVNALQLNVLIFASMAFFSNTGREITKGIVDVKGDQMQDVKTLTVRYGARKAAIAAAVFYLFAVLLSPIPWILHLVSVWFLPLVAITNIGLTTFSFMLLKDYSKENAKRIKNMLLFWFVLGLLGFVVGAQC